MKTMKTFEIEIQRHNVTPAQFLAYLRSMQKKHPEMAGDFDLNMFSREGWSFSYSNALPSEKPCEIERGTDKPYQKQTYIRNFDGTTYNEIIEFQFDDEKTGHGYYYTVQIDVAEEDREANTAENVAAIIRRRTEQADRQEAKAAKIEAETDDAERRGYTSEWWIEAQRTEAASLRREAAATREAITASSAQTAAEAPETAEETESEEQTTLATETTETAAPILLETLAAKLDRMTAAETVRAWAALTGPAYDGEAGTVDAATDGAIYKALQTIDPAAYWKWQNMPTPIDWAYSDSPERHTHMMEIEAEDVRNLFAAYGVTA